VGQAGDGFLAYPLAVGAEHPPEHRGVLLGRRRRSLPLAMYANHAVRVDLALLF
jgi:hypothetical protein